MSLKDRIKQAVAKADQKYSREELKQQTEDKTFNAWCDSIVDEIEGTTFKRDGSSYKIEVVRWNRETKVVLMRSDTTWERDILNKRYARWFVQLAELGYCDGDLYRVRIRDVGDFHHYDDLPEDKTDCYCNPENIHERAPQIKRFIHDALIKWIEPCGE